MKRIFALMLLLPLVACGTTGLRYAVRGDYQNLSAQGMAIWEDNAYLFNNTGLCRVYDLKSSSVIRDFWLGSASGTTHVNSACFGKEIPEGGVMPALYVGEWTNEGRLFVENVLPDRSEWIQTIKAVMNGEDLRIYTWAVDVENGFLYGLNRDNSYWGEDSPFENRIYKYKLPRLDEGREVILSEEDVLGSFTVYFSSPVQGSKIRGGCMYVVTGMNEKDERKNVERTVAVIDLKKGELVKIVDLSLVTTNEPEDMDFYKGRPLLWAGQSGGLYEFKL